MRAQRLVELVGVSAILIIATIVFRAKLWQLYTLKNNVSLNEWAKFPQADEAPTNEAPAVVEAEPTTKLFIQPSPTRLTETIISETLAFETQAASPSPPLSIPDRVIVMGKLSKEDTSWVSEHLPDWQSAIYVVDNRSAPLHTARNKGNEANAYLTYIIQNYYTLPSTMVFLHSHRKGYPAAWHNDAPGYDAVEMVRRLRIDFVQQNGYANLRCLETPGCPAEVQPFRDPPEMDRTIEHAMPEAWEKLFNNSDVPRILAAACCGQFAVSSEQVRKRPLQEYIRYYQWLMETPLIDATSGRVFEYLWHVIFGREPVYCPPMDQCYSDVYGSTWEEMSANNALKE